ncbi:hypothetical protein FP568_13400 [Pandoraea pnomenusa]|uniref:hypothetical protein n=1 Tax=Pandoraea pnomenusa TaxID=93220 RepID=UPI001198AED2|nr:hypothetical protein [Pandoraea pnomenusa]QDX22155.1 hypothetical protein FP568_13400 [Pandoraea pnomenusa]
MGDKHTPGPWHLMPRNEYRGPFVQRGYEGGFEVSGTTASREDVDARLIATAPERLEALEQIERLSRTADGKLVDVPAMLGDIARAALSKARGEQA